MPSRALLNIVTSLAFIEGILMMLKDANKVEPDSDIHLQIDELRFLVKKAHGLWPGNIDKKTLKKADRNMRQWEAEMFPDKRVDFIVLSSMAMAMLDEILQFITDVNKINCLSGIIDKLTVIHQHFDPNFEEDVTYYDTAKEAFNLWKKFNSK